MNELPKDLCVEAQRSSEALALTVCNSRKSRTERADIKALTREHLPLIRELWASFTKERENLSRYLMDPNKSCSAYLLGFHLPNLIRSLFVWQRTLQRQPQLRELLSQPERPVHILDMGCGTGATTIASLLFLKRLGLDMTRTTVQAYDRHGKFLDAFREGVSQIIPLENIKTNKLDFRQLQPHKIQTPTNAFVIVNLGYVWNEVAGNRLFEAKIAHILTKNLDRPARLIFMIEPANQYPSRHLMQLREELIGFGKVLYPCSHTESCPMLEKSKDWCYSEFSWVPTQSIGYIDKHLGINRSKLSCAALVIASATTETPIKTYKPDANSSIVVGRPQIKREGDHRFTKPDLSDFNYLLCDKKGLSKVRPSGKTIQQRGMIYTNDIIPK